MIIRKDKQLRIRELTVSAGVVAIAAVATMAIEGPAGAQPLPSGPAQQASTVIRDKVINLYTLDCLDYPSDGPRVGTWRCNGTWRQVWETPSIGGSDIIKNSTARKCLTWSGAGNDTSYLSCSSDERQIWTVKSDSHWGGFNIIHKKSGKCLDAPTDGGNRVIVWSCNNTKHQAWALS